MVFPEDKRDIILVMLKEVASYSKETFKSSKEIDDKSLMSLYVLHDSVEKVVEAIATFFDPDSDKQEKKPEGE